MAYSDNNKHHIAKAMQELGLNKSDLREIAPLQAKATLKKIVDRFCTRQDARWWWECFRKNLPAYSRQLDYAYNFLDQIVPVREEKVWLIVEEYHPISFRLYLGTVPNIQKVIGECPSFEYYLVACDYSWLVCENHHNYLIAVGDKVVARFQELFN